MAHIRIYSLITVLLAGDIILKTDATRIVYQAAFHASSMKTSRWTLLLTSRTIRHRPTATRQTSSGGLFSPTRLAELTQGETLEPHSASEQPSRGSGHLQLPQARTNPSTKTASQQQRQQPSITAVAGSLQLQEPNPKLRTDASDDATDLLKVDLAAGVTFQVRGDVSADAASAAAAASTHSFSDDTVAKAAASGSASTCSRMTGLLVANLSLAAERSGAQFLEPLTVERCGDEAFKIRGALQIPAAACRAISDVIYRDMPRWVNAALGRGTSAVAACGDGDEQYVTTAWAYGNADAGLTGGCVALAFTHVC